MFIMKFARLPVLLGLMFSRALVTFSSAAESPETAALRAKAEKGNSIAQYNLGLAYAQGVDGAADLPQAFVWLSLASDHGTNEKELDTVRARMSDDQLAEGQRLLAQRRAPLAAKPAAAPLRSPAPAKPEKLALNPPPAPPSNSSPQAAPLPARAASGDRGLAPSLERAGPTPVVQSKPAQDEVSSLRDDRKQLGQELASAWKELEKNRVDARAAAAQLSALTSKLAETETKLAAAQTGAGEVARERAHRDDPQSGLAQARQRTDELSAANSRLQAEAVNQMASLQSLRTENEQLKAAAGVAANEATALQTRVASLEQQLASQHELLAKANSAPAVDPATDAKLAVALRSYQLLQDELEKTKAEAARTAGEKASLDLELGQAKRAIPVAAEAVALREQLRQTQAQAASAAEENLRLKTQLSLGVSAPTRPSPAGSGPPASAIARTTNARETTAAPAPATPNAEPRTHLIVAGDTLTRISALYYGTPNRWNDVLAANRDLVRDEHSLVIGRTLRIP